MAKTKRVKIEPLYEARKPFWSYHDRRQRFAILNCHRRSGKTVATLNDLLERALMTPGGLFGFVAPYYSQGKDVAWSFLKFYAEPFLAEPPSESELKVKLGNGATVRIWGADNPDRLRGLGFDGLVCDEYADWRPDVWAEVLRPAIADKKGFVTFVGTPKGRNNFFDTWQQAQKDKDWFKLELKASDSGIIPPDELEDARRTMSKEQVSQEFECSFDSPLIGAFYSDEIARMVKDGRITRLPIERSVPVHVSFDLGISDSTAIWLCQAIGKERRLIGYHEASGVGLDYYAGWLRDQDLIYSNYYFPHDVQVRELGTGQSRYDTLVGLGIDPTVVPQHAVLDGINATRRFLDTCWIDPDRCGRGFEALKQYRRDWDPALKAFRQKPRHGWESHGADSLRYMATGFEERAEVKKPKPRRWGPSLKGSWMGA
jgi:phage terminase large subunit